MKYKNKDGQVFKSVEDAFWNYCAKKLCCVCPFDCIDKGSLSCVEFAEQKQDETARVLGLEVIPEDGDHNNVPANDVPNTNVGDKLKPINKWTLEEVADYCCGRSCEECIFFKANDDSVCKFRQRNPVGWGFIWMIEFTHEEVADAKALVRVFPGPFDTIKRCEDGSLIAVRNGGMADRLHKDAFPSIKPGQSVKLSEIVGFWEV